MTAKKKSKAKKKQKGIAKNTKVERANPVLSNKETTNIKSTAKAWETKEYSGWIEPENLPKFKEKKTVDDPVFEIVKKIREPEMHESEIHLASSKVSSSAVKRKSKEHWGWTDPEYLPSQEEKAIVKKPLFEILKKTSQTEGGNLNIDIPVKKEPSSSEVSIDEIEQINDKSTHLIAFELGKEKYAVPIELIKGVVETPTVITIPETPKFVKGVGNIKGSTIAIIDLVEWFGIDDKINSNGAGGGRQGEFGFTLIVECGEHDAGILLEKAPHSLIISSNQIERGPNIIHNFNGNSNCIKGFIKVDTGLVILIDICTIINTELERLTNQAVEVY